MRILKTRTKAFLGEELDLNPQTENWYEQHNQAQLAMAEWEEIIYRAIIRVIKEVIGEN